ncbi:hypothetical protein BJ322DRAFT_1069780 [Thelephora terrestris]|uniref:BTB domain-containing protein n=1 Tax=Thelephora terrestris TaxID=56493 RepID=A0A9P6HBL9_9AGAM|nr:hypothetical protein BJ322DRAFT_1069780 [Thelephora terrestris]
MSDIDKWLISPVGKLSDQNYEESFALYRLWFDIRRTYFQIPSDRLFDDIWGNRFSSEVSPKDGKLFHPTAHLILRFVKDTELDCILGPHSAGLQRRFSARTVQVFFENNVLGRWGRDQNWRSSSRLQELQSIEDRFAVDSNLLAWWANSGYVEEATIRNHILQSLTSHPKLYEHQASALIILFKTAGATFEAYADPSVVDRCIELLKNHYGKNTIGYNLVQEVLKLRERGWEGLPPPPVLAIDKPEPHGTSNEDPSATPVVTSLGLSNTDFEPQITYAPPLKQVTSPESEITPSSPVIQSPPTSISTLSDFTIPDPSDDESLIDSTGISPHGTLNFEDGNVEVLCGNTLFRVHTSILSLHSPALRQMFPQENLATVESPNGCPRILSPDKATDFAALLKTVYLPGFPEREKVPDFDTFSSLLRITAKYEMPAVRPQLLKVVHDAYPETFEGVTPTRPLGESVFSGPTPHPNEVLNLFVQQDLTSALPMAYYMAVRRGVDSLMDRRLPQSATLSPDVLQTAIKGLIELREMERDETHKLIFGPKGPQPCSELKCPSRGPPDPAALGIYKKVFDDIVGPSQLGTKVLQVPKFPRNAGGRAARIFPVICSNCVEDWESGHANLRRRAWARLPEVFGLKG